MEQFKNAKVVLLPTEKKTGIFCDNNDKLYFSLVNKIRDYAQGKHLYIISDDEIKEGDWCLNIASPSNRPFQIDRNGIVFISNNKHKTKKIITTTDLLDRNYELDRQLPQPSQQFIEKYIEEYNKGEIITDVLVEYYKSKPDDARPIDWYLKTNPKDNTITIKQVKDSWNREEVIKLCSKAYNITPNYPTILDNFDKWVKENL